MPSGQGTQSVNLGQINTSEYPSASNASASADQVVIQACDPSARPICNPKSKLSSLKAMAVGLPQTYEAQWQSYLDPNGPQYPSVQYYNGGDGSSQGTAVYDQGYGYPQPSWNGGQLAYNDGFSDQYGLQPQAYGRAYRGKPSEAFDVFGQLQEPDLPGSSAMYSWGEVCSHVAAKDEELTAAKDQEISFLRQSAARNLSDQLRIDKEEYLGILGQKDHAYNEMEGRLLALEASVPGKPLKREQATRKIGEDLFKDEKQKWSDAVAAKDSRIQELENQLNQAINAPRPQPQVIVQADPRVASLQEQIAAYEAADRARAEEEGHWRLKTQKSANDLKEALKLIKTLRQEKTALETSEKDAKRSVGGLTADNKDLTQQLKSSKSEAENLKKEKTAAEEKVVALETQIQNTPRVHPDTGNELRYLVSRVKDLEESVKEVATFRSQLRESEEEGETLQIEADKVPTLIKELEQRNERVAKIVNIASDAVRYRRRLILSSDVPADLLNSGPVAPQLDDQASATVVGTPAKPAWLEALHNDQPRKLICDIALTAENTDLKDVNAKLSKDIRTAKEEKTRAEADLSNITGKFQTQKYELTRVQKIKDMLAKALVLLGIFLLFYVVCIPRLLPTPSMGNSTTSPTIRQSPLRTEVLSKIHKLPDIQKTNNLQFEDLFPEYRLDDLEVERCVAESIRVDEIYEEYVAVVIEKASQRTFPKPTTSYPHTTSPSQEHAVYREQPVREGFATSPPSPMKSSKQEEKSGLQDWFDGVKECVLGGLIIWAFLVVWALGSNVWEFFKWRSERDGWIAEHNEKHRLIDIEKAHREGSQYHVFFGDECEECQATDLARKGFQSLVHCGGA